NLTYQWTFPDGSTSAAQNPSIPLASLAAQGTYLVRIVQCGCPSTATPVNVTVSPDAGPPGVTAPAPVAIAQSTCTGPASSAD
ncbi:MAG TPA: hypothetical protein VGR00_11535, partial [Thermoanaerobaculia bacterium]|nr:hypothetical protein [Thermoanaerobaculia bacterium]